MGRKKMYEGRRVSRTFQIPEDIDQKLDALSKLSSTSYHDYCIKIFIAHTLTSTETQFKKTLIIPEAVSNPPEEQLIWLESNLPWIQETFVNYRSLLDLHRTLSEKRNKRISKEVLENFLGKYNLKIV